MSNAITSTKELEKLLNDYPIEGFKFQVQQCDYTTTLSGTTMKYGITYLATPSKKNFEPANVVSSFYIILDEVAHIGSGRFDMSVSQDPVFQVWANLTLHR